MSTTMTIRFDEETRLRLDQLAGAMQRSRSYLAGEAIREFIELNEWQIGEIRQATEEADRGEFAANMEVKEFFAHWRSRAS